MTPEPLTFLTTSIRRSYDQLHVDSQLRRLELDIAALHQDPLANLSFQQHNFEPVLNLPLVHQKYPVSKFFQVIY